MTIKFRWATLMRDFINECFMWLSLTFDTKTDLKKSVPSRSSKQLVLLEHL